MKINLRKALKLRKSIEATLGSPAVNSQISVSVDDQSVVDDPGTKIQAAREALKATIEQHIALSDILARLRVSIAQANAVAGVEELLARSAKIDRNINLLKTISVPSDETAETVKNKIRRVHASLERGDRDRYSAPSPIVSGINVVDQDLASDSAARIARLRREKEEVDEARMATNAGHFIEIGEDDEKLLRDLNII